MRDIYTVEIRTAYEVKIVRVKAASVADALERVKFNSAYFSTRKDG